MRAQLYREFAPSRRLSGTSRWTRSGTMSGVLDVTLPRAARVAILDLRENIAQGQRIARYRVEGRRGDAWHVIAQGTTIGYRRLERVTADDMRQLRLVVDDAVTTPIAPEMHVYSGGE
jgi:alpha-L-fucosidase